MEIIIELANIVQLQQLAVKLTKHGVEYKALNSYAIKVVTLDWALGKSGTGVVLISGTEKRPHMVKLKSNEFIRVVLQ